MAVFIAAALFVLLIYLQFIVYRKYWDKNLNVGLEMSAKSLFEGEHIRITEKVENRKLLPLPWLEVYFELSTGFESVGIQNRIGTDTQYRSDIYCLLFNRRANLPMDFTCRKRGYFRVTRYTATGNNLLMSDRLSKHADKGSSITVYPKIIDVDGFEVPYKKISGEILAQRFINHDPFEFKGIREYQPYDSFKAINFKASARTGVLMSNIFDFTVSQEVVIILNLKKNPAAYSGAIGEDAIRLAAFFARYFIGEGIPAGFVTNGRDSVTESHTGIPAGLSQTHLYNIYDALARIDLRQFIPSPEEILPDPENPGDRVYILISAYQGEEISGWHNRMSAAGKVPLWVIPYAEEQEILTVLNENVVAWRAGK